MNLKELTEQHKALLNVVKEQAKQIWILQDSLEELTKKLNDHKKDTNGHKI